MGKRPERPQQEEPARQAPAHAAKQETTAAKPGSSRPTLMASAHYSRDAGYRGTFQFTFTKAMIDPDTTPLGQAIPPEEFPILFTPPLPGEGKWLDARNLSYTPYDPIPQATPIDLKARPGVASLDGEAWQQNFTPYIPYPFTWSPAEQIRYGKDGSVTVALSFSRPVDEQRLRESLQIRLPSGDALPFELTRDISLNAPAAQQNRRFLVTMKPEKLSRVIFSLPADFTCSVGPQPLSAREKNDLVDGRISRPCELSSMFAIKTVRARQSDSPPWSRYIAVDTNNDVTIDEALHYIGITPETKIFLEARSGGFDIHGDFPARPRVSLIFKKGMTGLVGSLIEDFKATVVFDDFSPRLSLDSGGTILSSQRATRVPLSSINVERVQATLWQVPESNIPLMAMGFFDGYQKHLSRKLSEKTGEIHSERNRQADTSLDLAQLAGKAKGVFLLSVKDASDPATIRSVEPDALDKDEYFWEYEYYEDIYDAPARVEQLVVISDIGIMARTMPRSITVWANSIATTKALKNARVRVFSRNNILLAEGRTDSQGLWHYAPPEAWERPLRPAIILVSTETSPAEASPETPAGAETTDIAYLKLDQDLSADDSFDTGGRDYLAQGYEAFCFTPRGIFRPGETVDFKILLRDAALHAPKPFPVAWKVISSTGRTVGQGNAMLSENGGASFNLALVPSAPTGSYVMSVSVPGQPRVLGSCSFAVEDFQPPRMEVALTADAPSIQGGTHARVAIDAQYLFGAPAADAPWEASTTLQPYSFTPPAWRGFTFPLGQPSKASSEYNTQNGHLDAKGTGSFAIPAPSAEKANALTIVSTVRVREDGGRWVVRNISFPWFKNSILLGYEPQKAEAQAGAPYSLRVAAVTPEGKAASLASIKAIAEKIEEYWVRSDRGHAKSRRYTEVASMEVPLNKGLGVFTFTPESRGEYRVRLVDESTGAECSGAFSVWSGLAGPDEGGSPLVDRVMLSWDKPSYKANDTARLTIRTPFTGKLLLVLETDRELYRQIITITQSETTILVPILEAMAPNAYCSAWIIRPVAPGEPWGAHRAYGVVPLRVDQSEAKLQMSIAAPKEILPASNVEIQVNLKDAEGNPVKGEVALALVDEGLLSMTNFKTPDPFGFFTSQRGLASYAYDLYDALMPLTERRPITLKPGGGMGADGSLLSPLSRKLELLSISPGLISTDEQGRVAATLKLPEYSGKGRIMAVAATGTAVGHAQASLKVARSLTVEATTPRLVAPGDSFEVPVFVFASSPAPRQATLKVICEGPLSLEGPGEYPVRLDEHTPKVFIPLKLTAEAASGMGVLRLVADISSSDEENFEQRLEIPVRPPFPRLTRTGSGIVRGGETAEIAPGGGFFPGTEQIKLSFSASPTVGLLTALNYLGSYPYGCLEQTISTAWPYLAAPTLLKSLDPELAENSEYRQALDFAIRRVLSMQRFDGGFNTWPGTSLPYPWGSAYAAHFLTEAGDSGLVPQDSFRAALAWLRGYLSTPLPEKGTIEIRDALSTKAYICYVLALNNDAPLGWMHFLKEQGNLLSTSGKIFLAGAYAVATGKADALRELGVLPLPNERDYGRSMESQARNEALRLLMWAQTDPFAPETATLAARILEDGAKDRWYSTQENGMAVLALGRYTEKTSGRSKDFTATLFSLADGNHPIPLAEFSDKETPVFTNKDLLLAGPATESASLAPVRVALEGNGSSYYSWTNSGVPLKAAPAHYDGLNIARRWELDDGTVYDFDDFNPESPLKTDSQEIVIPHGSRVTVTLYLKPEAGFNSLVLADVLPGGFEIENPNLVPDENGGHAANNAGSKSAPPAAFAQPARISEWGDARIEMRDDRLLLFVDAMPAGASAFSYTIRAVTKGVFTLPPLSAEAMYDPAIQALTKAGKVKVE